MKINKLPRQVAVTCTVLAQKSAQRQGPMGRSLLLDRNANPERCMAVFYERSEPLAKSAWSSKQIDNAERVRQSKLLISFN